MQSLCTVFAQALTASIIPYNILLLRIIMKSFTSQTFHVEAHLKDQR